MSKIYFVRHGESEWNVADRICGQTDVPLTAKGHEQARETGRKIIQEGIKAEMILCSPLLRAKNTAQHISEITGIPLQVEPRLMEQNFGVWEGSSPRRSEEFHAAKKEFLSRYGNGESMFQLAQRIYNLLDELKKENKNYILVAHNGISRVIRSYFGEMTNEEYAAYGVKNCSVTMFDFSYDAVVFDMDGVIFDSERATMDCWLELAEKYKIPNIEEPYLACIGITKERTKEIMLHAYGEDFPFDSYAAEESEMYHKKGYAIVSNNSGKHNGESHISYRGRKRLRYVLYEAAISVIGKNAEFKEIHHYYRSRDKNPLKKMQSVIAVACKLIRIFYMIMTKGIDYDGAKMLGDIRRPTVSVA